MAASDSPLETANAVTFDVTLGQARLRANPATLATVVSAAALSKLLATAGSEAAAEFGASVGASLGDMVLAMLGDQTASASGVDRMVTLMAEAVATCGFGRLVLERWGQALVLALEGAAHVAPDPVLARIIASMVARVTGRDVSGTVLGRQGDRLRVLLGSPPATREVARWISEGVSWGDAVVRLHARHEGVA